MEGLNVITSVDFKFTLFRLENSNELRSMVLFVSKTKLAPMKTTNNPQLRLFGQMASSYLAYAQCSVGYHKQLCLVRFIHSSELVDSILPDIQNICIQHSSYNSVIVAWLLVHFIGSSYTKQMAEFLKLNLSYWNGRVLFKKNRVSWLSCGPRGLATWTKGCPNNPHHNWTR